MVSFFVALRFSKSTKKQRNRCLDVSSFCRCLWEIDQDAVQYERDVMDFIHQIVANDTSESVLMDEKESSDLVCVQYICTRKFYLFFRLFQVYEFDMSEWCRVLSNLDQFNEIENFDDAIHCIARTIELSEQNRIDEALVLNLVGSILRVAVTDFQEEMIEMLCHVISNSVCSMCSLPNCLSF